jgi:hypothetical protein
MMVRAPPAYCGGRSVTPKKITVATARQGRLEGAGNGELGGRDSPEAGK